MKWTKECGKRLRETREALGWKRDELGKATGNGAENLTLWERANRSPEVGDLKVLVSVLGASVPYLLCQTDDPKGGAEPFGPAPKLSDFVTKEAASGPPTPRPDPRPPQVDYGKLLEDEQRSEEEGRMRTNVAEYVRQQRRDLFAAAALTGLLAGDFEGDKVASAFAIADRMLEDDR